MKKILSLLTVTMLLLPALITYAEATPPKCPTPGVLCLNDPLGITEGPFELYGRLISGFMFIVGAAALAFFVMGGFWWLTSGGNEEKIKKGRDTLLWATIGMAAIFGSYFILSYIITVLLGTTGVPVPVSQ